MKKFLKKIGIFLAILILVSLFFVIFDLLIVGNQHSQGYNAALLDKIERLESIDSPKIILIGDSSVAFGFDSKMIEEALGMPTVNIGLHGGIGNAYYENIVAPYISEGDIVILGYCTYETPYFPDKGLALTMLEKNKPLWEVVETEEKMGLLKAYPYYAYSCLAKFITFSGNKGDDSCYSRDAFNEYGDIVKRPREENRHETISVYENTVKVPQQPSEVSVKRINDFNKFVESKAATLLITTVPVFDCEYTPAKEDFEELEQILENELECKMISKFENYFFEREMFYDSVLHLNTKGAKARTAQFILDLKNYLNENK